MPHSPVDVDRLAYKPASVAEQLDCSVQFVFTMIRDGRLPSVQIGRARRVLRTDLVAYLDSLRGAA